MPAPEHARRFADLRIKWNEYKNRLIFWALLGLLAAFVVGSFVPLIGDWLQAARFGGAALTVAVALIVLDAVTSQRVEAPERVAPVVERSSQLTPYFLAATDNRLFSVVFAGYSGETLYRILSDCFDEISKGRTRTERVTIRLLLPDCDRPMSLPCSTADLEDFPPYRELSARRTEEYVRKIESAVARLKLTGAIKHGEFDVRYHRLPPVMKAYIINDELAFWGLYPIEQSTYRSPVGTDVPVYDAKGTRAAMFGVDANGDSTQALVYRNLVSWLDTVWDTVATPARDDAVT